MKVKVLVAQSCDPKDCSLPCSTVHGILQGRILEWIAFPFSRWSSQPRDWTWVSCIGGRFFTIWTTREAWCSCMHSDKCMGSCVHHPSVIMNGSIILKLCVVPYSFQNSPSRILCFFWVSYKRGYKIHSSFLGEGLASLTTVEFSKFAGILNAALKQHHLLGFAIA